MLLISGHILDALQKLRLFGKWDKGMGINPEDETSNTTQYEEAFPKYVENENCADHRPVPVIELKSSLSSNLIPSPKASGFCRSSVNPYDLSSNDEEYKTPNNVAERTPKLRDRADSYWLRPGSISICCLKLQESWGKLIQISMITTPTQ